MANADQPEWCIVELKSSLQCDPDNTDKLYELGRALESAGRVEEALSAFEAIVRLEPDDHESLHAVGLLYYKLGNVPNALLHLRRATALWDEQPEYFADLGDALRSSGDIQGARAAYEKALSLTLPNEDIAERLKSSL